MLKIKNYFILNAFLVFIFSFLFIYYANADNLSDGTIEITANNNMEWDQSENKILAYGGANVKSNKFSINADKIIGVYDGNIGEGNIKSLIAISNAYFISEKATIQADNINYYLIKDLVEVTGSKIFMTFKEGSINADKRLIFKNRDREVLVDGNVNIIINKKGNIKAQNIVIKSDEIGNIILIKANGRVEIFLNTLKQKVNANEAKFDLQNSKIDFLGKVVLQQGKSFLKGDKALVNLESGISKISSNENRSVSGMFVK